jgi:hypothetical protein
MSNEAGSLNEVVRLAHRALADTDIVGHLRYHPIKISAIAPDTSGEQSITFLYPIDIVAGRLYGVVNDADKANAADPDDEIIAYCEIGVVGIVAQAASINDTQLTVSSTVTDNVDVGHFVVIDSNEYEVIAKDIENFTIDISPGLIAAAAVNDTVSLRPYFAGTPTNPMRFTAHRVDYDWGRDTIDSTRLPTGKALVIKYVNKDTVLTKSVYGEVAILY